MKFWKMNGAGNDFILIDNRMEKLPSACFPALARRLCERRLSLGADGLMVVEESETADLKMLFFNSDGSIGEMCGNGARCICRFAWETGLAGPVQRIETTAGPVSGTRISERMYRIRLNDPSLIRTDLILQAAGRRVPCSYVVLGDPGIPHAVVPFEDLAAYPEDSLRELARALRFHEAFPKGANVNFVELTGPDEVLLKTYERGVEDFTYACGTGTGSSAAVLTLLGQISGQNVRFTMRGGDLYMDAVREGDTVRDLYLTGPTNIVARGEITDDELKRF